MRASLITEHDTLEDVTKEIDILLAAQPDAQIVSIIPMTRKTLFGQEKQYYSLVTIRTFNGFSD